MFEKNLFQKNKKKHSQEIVEIIIARKFNNEFKKK